MKLAKKGMRRAIFTIAAVAVAFGAQPAGAIERFSSSYSVSVLGLRVASSSFTTTVNGEAVSIEGTLKSSGLARLFDDTTGSTVVRAKVNGQGVFPAAYDIRYVSGKKNKRTAISFASGKVAKTLNNPPLKKHAVYVPLKPEHLQGVFDPMTALLIKADTPQAVCKRTVRVFDGEVRVDLKLSPAGEVPFSTKGFKGNAIRCSAKFVPVAGYRPDKNQIKYLRDKSRIEIAFAPIGAENLYAPVKATVGTQIGQVTVYATRFGSSN